MSKEKGKFCNQTCEGDTMQWKNINKKDTMQWNNFSEECKMEDNVRGPHVELDKYEMFDEDSESDSLYNINEERMRFLLVMRMIHNIRSLMKQRIWKIHNFS